MQTRSIFYGNGRPGADAFATPAIVQSRKSRRLLEGWVDRFVHLPPSIFSVSIPYSGKFGLLSSRAISRWPNSSLSGIGPLAFGLSRRWNMVISTETTPDTDCARAYSSLEKMGCLNVNLSG